MAAPKKTVAKEAGQDKANGSPPEFTREQELKALRDMLLIRRFEEKAGQLYGMGAIGGFCHLYIGQEAVVVGMQMALKQGDQVITGYRDHGHMLATRHGRQGRDGGTDRAPRRLFQGQGRLHAHVQQGEEFLRRPRHRRRPGARSAPGSLSPTATAAMTSSAWPISATAPPTRARSMRASTWRSCGSCR